MKYIIAVIKPHRLENVKSELANAGVHLMTVVDALGCGRQQGITEVYRGVKEVGNLLRKVKIEVGITEDFLEPAIEAIIKGAKEDLIGDGKIFVFNMEDCVRIRTGERGKIAIG